MSDTTRALVLASFAGDSLSLGAHWIYDPKRIQEQFGRVETLLAPQPGTYHAGKEAGDFTHYGDQMFVLLESVAAKGGFDLDDFATRWKALFDGYKGYFDGATKKTLARFEFGSEPESAGSTSIDLAGASRIAPLVCKLHGDATALVEAARAQTKMTHATTDVVDAAAFFAHTALECLSGAHPEEAMKNAAKAEYVAGNIPKWVEKGLSTKGNDTVETIQKLGPTCHVDEALPGAVHLIASYPDAPKKALVECVMAGGDSAARAMLVGMVLLAWPENGGLQALPNEWISGMRRAEEIEKLLDSMA